MHLESEGVALKSYGVFNRMNSNNQSNIQLTDSCVSAASYYSMAPGGTKLEKKQRLSSYKLDSRPGMLELLQRFPDQKLATSIADGYKLSLNSLMYSHQRIIQLFNILAYSGPEWEGLNKAFRSSGDLEAWHKNYLQSIGTIEEQHVGLFRTLCSLLANTASRLGSDETSTDLQSLLADMKDHKQTPLDPMFLPWGRGSTVHSLVDSIFLFSKDNKIVECLRGVFTEQGLRQSAQQSQVEDLVEREIERIEKVFEDDDIEFAVERYFEIEQRKVREIGEEAVKEIKIPGKGLFVGRDTEFGESVTGYGILVEDEKKVYRGEFRRGEFWGLGELYNPKNGSAIYKGNFRMGKPEGMGIYYHNKLMLYRGQLQSGRKHGVGEDYESDGKLFYRGDFHNNLREGFGILYFKNGRRAYIGEFKHGKKDGRGTEFDSMGVPLREGNWRQDTYINAVIDS
jgi:antitoxin component YwqK of YwqJK toxin-antitoxin module